MKVLAICVHGLGTSLLMKMTVDTCFKELGIKDVQIEVSGHASGKGYDADLFIITEDLISEFDSDPARKDKYIAVKQVLDKEKMKEKIQAYLDKIQFSSD
jgi:PTS system ascorbate-specific IIB component